MVQEFISIFDLTDIEPNKVNKKYLRQINNLNTPLPRPRPTGPAPHT